MIVKLEVSRLRQTQWWEYLARFAFGGLVTVMTGLVAAHFGAAVGGLFLAFPGIFPAGITLVERHERKKKEQRGLRGTRRGREVAAVASAGAALGSFGLAAFAATAWGLLPRVGTATAVCAAGAAWLAFAVLGWAAWRRRRATRRF